MSERIFRLILGSGLILLLFLQEEFLIYCYIGLLLFEGVTNWRIPILVSRLRYGEFHEAKTPADPECKCIAFDAERALRFVVASMLIVTYIIFPEQAWFFPWFIGFMLFMAGLTNICPMVMSLRWLGLR
jgi:hypothetical protein